MPSLDTSPGADQGVVLVVEDEPTLQMFIELVLASGGYRVVSARDGTEALRLFTEHDHAFALVLTDLQLPGLNGLELVRAIRTKDRNIPIVVESGTMVEWSMAELKTLDVTAFVRKPFSAAQLLKTISGVRAHPKTSGP